MQMNCFSIVMCEQIGWDRHTDLSINSANTIRQRAAILHGDSRIVTKPSGNDVLKRIAVT